MGDIREILEHLELLLEAKSAISVDTSSYEKAMEKALGKMIEYEQKAAAKKSAGEKIDDYFQKNEASIIHKLIEDSKRKIGRGLATEVQRAIGHIEDWNGTAITISAEPREDSYGVLLEPAEDGQVYLGAGAKHESDTETPYFTAWFRGKSRKVQVEDVLESGDKDFFKDPKVESDYFNLVQELRHPGTRKSTKILTLYTARPAKDRATYENAKDIPSGIFLVNSLDHAEGLAVDLGGSKGERDVYRLKIEERYLLKTNDTPTVKYYQVVATPGGKVPVKSITLL